MAPAIVRKRKVVDDEEEINEQTSKSLALREVFLFMTEFDNSSVFRTK
jgi:hypothetical protein